MFDGIVDAIHREMDMLDQKYSAEKTALSVADLEHIDKMAHALKCLVGYEMYLRSNEDSGSYRNRGRYDGYRRY